MKYFHAYRSTTEYWKHFLPFVFGVALCSAPAYAQTPSSLTADEVGYFVSVFESIGSADVVPDILNNNEAAVQRIFDLNAEESALLHSAAQNYRTMMTHLRRSEKSITAGAKSLTESHRLLIGRLIQTRDHGVKSLAEAFLGSLRPQAAARLLADAQKVINLRATKGAQ